METILEKLADFAQQLKFEDLPRNVVRKANDCLLDFAGCYYAAVGRDDMPKVIRGIAAINPAPESRIWGTDLKCGIAEAALAMGTAGYYLRFRPLGQRLHSGDISLCCPKRRGREGSDHRHCDGL